MRRNLGIDILRIFMAFLVVCQHIETYLWDEYIIPQSRIAVPVFFIISGYFLYDENRDKVHRKIVKSFKHVLRIFLLSTMLYALYGIWENYPDGNFNFLKIGPWKLFVFIASCSPINFPYGFHLWFLIGLLEGLVIMLCLNKLKLFNRGGVILPLFISIIGVTIRLIYPNHFIPFFKLCFSVMPSLLLGYSTNHFISHRNINLNQLAMLLLLISCMALTALETWIYSDYQLSTYMMTLATSLVIFLLFLRSKCASSKIANFIAALGKDCSLGVYIIHPIVIGLLVSLFGKTFWIVQPWYVFILSTVFVYGYNQIRNVLLSKIKNNKHSS